MSGRGISVDTPRRNTPQGLYTRLKSHASGRRSGDQFCVYIADRLVLPTLSRDDIAAIASGHRQMDAFVRRYIHENTHTASWSYRMEPRHTRLKRLSKAAAGRMAVRYSIPEGNR